MSKPSFLTRLTLLSFCIFILSSVSIAQVNAGRPDKLFFRSGFGFTLPVGESSDYLSPKFSTSLGGLLFLGKGNFFLYPKLGLNAYGYDQNMLDPGTSNRLENGRGTTYLLTVNLGYRTTADRFGFYGFGGGGGGIILLPKISNPEGNVITMRNASNSMALLEAGLGADYSFGNVLLFLEGSYTHAINKLENQSYQAVPLSMGIRTNISKLFFK